MIKDGFNQCGDSGIVEISSPVDHKTLMKLTEELSGKYPNLEILRLGNSLLGKEIPILKFGRGTKNILYVASHHGMEWITTALSIMFVNDFFESVRHKINVGNINPALLLESVTFFVVPMLNPDGVEYSLRGVSEDNPLLERLLKMNRNSDDFSHWQANARGVDLNHNYDCGFTEYKTLEIKNGILEGAPTRYSGEYPESEPETAALCAFIRNVGFSLVLSLHSQGEEIYYSFKGDPEITRRNKNAAENIANLCGYDLKKPQGMALYGGLSDWCGEIMGIPSFTFECGVGCNPLPICDYKSIYTKIRRALFCAPNLF